MTCASASAVSHSVAGGIAGIDILLICTIVVPVLALVVVMVLKRSPWGTFTVFRTIPIAMLSLWSLLFASLTPAQAVDDSRLGQAAAA